MVAMAESVFPTAARTGTEPAEGTGMSYRICTLNLSAGAAPSPLVCSGPTHDRLKKAVAELEEIEAMRAMTNNWLFGKFTEDRLIWRELLELELQDVEEQVERICHGETGAFGPQH
jgi:hypothetical protein